MRFFVVVVILDVVRFYTLPGETRTTAIHYAISGINDDNPQIY